MVAPAAAAAAPGLAAAVGRGLAWIASGLGRVLKSPLTVGAGAGVAGTLYVSDEAARMATIVIGAYVLWKFAPVLLRK